MRPSDASATSRDQLPAHRPSTRASVCVHPARRSSCMRKTALLMATFAFVLLGASSASAQSVAAGALRRPDLRLALLRHGRAGASEPRLRGRGTAGRSAWSRTASPRAPPFLDISGEVCSQSDCCGFEAGMFSMAFAPDYATSGLFYVFFTQDDGVPGPGHHLVIREFRRDHQSRTTLTMTTGRDVLVISHPDEDLHNGGQLQFGPDKLLYVCHRGRAAPRSARPDTLLSKLCGSIHATLAGYSLPPDRPVHRGPGDARDLFLRPPEPLPLLLRSKHGRSHHR